MLSIASDALVKRKKKYGVGEISKSTAGNARLEITSSLNFKFKG